MLTKEEVEVHESKIISQFDEIKILYEEVKEIEPVKNNYEYYLSLYEVVFKYLGVELYVKRLIIMYGVYIGDNEYLDVQSRNLDILEKFKGISNFNTLDNKISTEFKFTSLIHEVNLCVGRLENTALNIALSAQFSMINSRVSSIDALQLNLRNYADEQKQLAIDEIRQLSNQIKNNMLETLDESTEEILGRINNAEGSISKFKAKIDEHTNMLVNLAKNVTDQVKDIVDSASNQVNETVVPLQNKATEYVVNIEKNVEKAKKLLGIIGDLGLAGSFKSIASKEGWSAFYMRSLTIVILLIGAAFAMLNLLDFVFPDIMRQWVAHFFDVSNTPAKVANLAANTINSSNLTETAPSPVNPPANIWAMVTLRIATAFIIIAPAFYFAKESSRHRHNADRSKRIEAELISLLAFIEDLDKCDKDEVRKKLTDRYFVGNISETKVDRDTGLPIEFVQKTIEKIIDKSVDVFGDVTKQRMNGNNDESTDCRNNKPSTSSES